METYRARRVLRADRGGSSWPVLIDTDAGVFYTKLRGAAQAPASLVAEIVVGALADTLGLPVPARVLIDLPPGVRVDDPHEELAQLLHWSIGRNLGFQLLSDVRGFRPTDVDGVDSELASKIVWLDGLVQNADRTAKNPNLLWSHGQLWLIDHGASLGFHHDWSSVTEDSPRTRVWPREDHALRSRATRLRLVDEALAARLDRDALASALDVVPDDFLSDQGEAATRRRRTAYVAFLWKRLKGPRPFLPTEVQGRSESEVSDRHAVLPQQAAAIAVRWNNSAFEVCLIRKMGSKNWGIPKGLVDPGDTHAETALKEAWEEAGITGRLIGDALGYYQYDKWDATFEVAVYLMEVQEQHARWQEAGFRERRWTSFSEAASLLADHPARAFLDRAKTLATQSIG